MQNPLLQYLPQPQPAGKVYLVAKHPGCLVGYEQLIIMHVDHSAQEAFLKQYAKQILLQGNSAEEVRAKLNALPTR